ncbi:unnamed protein product, partial [Scytosiphon promiscuus]
FRTVIRQQSSSSTARPQRVPYRSKSGERRARLVRTRKLAARRLGCQEFPAVGPTDAQPVEFLRAQFAAPRGGGPAETPCKQETGWPSPQRRGSSRTSPATLRASQPTATLMWRTAGGTLRQRPPEQAPGRRRRRRCRFRFRRRHRRPQAAGLTAVTSILEPVPRMRTSRQGRVPVLARGSRRRRPGPRSAAGKGSPQGTIRNSCCRRGFGGQLSRRRLCPRGSACRGRVDSGDWCDRGADPSGERW